MNTQHRPRIDSTIATASCAATIQQGRAILKSMRDLNPKLDKWKIREATDELVALETTYAKFSPFSTDHKSPFLMALAGL